MPFSPLRLILLLAALAFLVTFVQLGVLTVAFDKLGLSPHSAYLLFMATLLGSLINVPLFRVKSEAPENIDQLPPQIRRLFQSARWHFPGQTVIAVNLGGCVTPVAFSLYLLAHHPLNPLDVMVAIATVTTLAHLFSRPLQGIGIVTPIIIPPFTAAFIAIGLDPQHSAPLAYIGGTLGVLIGADLMRLNDIRKMGAPIASIGGAGSFDGIFITGLVAVLLA